MGEWVCSNCKKDLDGDRPGVPCPACGHMGRTIEVVIKETVEVLSSVRVRKDVPGLPKKKRTRVDDFQGWETRRSVGDLVRKVRRIDKDADAYFEQVQDRDGNIIHHCDEPLSSHRGHGSAKPK